MVEQREKASADKDGVANFTRDFQSTLEEYSLDQLFNCDETGLYFRQSPSRTLVIANEGKPDGRKKSKDRITINPCANGSGSIKLPLQLIGKSMRPCCFRNVLTANTPVVYASQKSTWMD